MVEIAEWISFTNRDGERFIFDLSFLLSDYRCSFGNGCPGIENAHESKGCCAHGAHLYDQAERESIIRLASKLDGSVFEKRYLVCTEEDLFQEVDGDTVTAVVDEACIFFNSGDFAGGYGCAFHLHAQNNGLNPNDLKPQVCWHVPIRIEYLQEATGSITTMVRSWRRSDWGEGGFDFQFWCLDHLVEAKKFKHTALVTLADELTRLVGKKVYKRLLKEAKQRFKAKRIQNDSDKGAANGAQKLSNAGCCSASSEEPSSSSAVVNKRRIPAELSQFNNANSAKNSSKTRH